VDRIRARATLPGVAQLARQARGTDRALVTVADVPAGSAGAASSAEVEPLALYGYRRYGAPTHSSRRSPRVA
jgi:hypothetical protein